MNRAVNWCACVGAVVGTQMLFACSSDARLRTEEAEADRAPVARGGLIAQDGPFKIEMRSLAVAAQREFWNAGEPRPSSRNSTTGTLILELHDARGYSLYRVAAESRVTAVEEHGRALLTLPAFYRPDLMRGDAFVSARARVRPSPEHSVQFSLPLSSLPGEVSRIAGVLEIDVAAEETELTVDIPALQESVEAFPGLTIITHTLEREETRDTAGLEIEARSPLNAEGRPQGEVVRLEIADENGTVIAPLELRQEYAIGGVVKRRYEPARGYMSRAKKPARLRIRWLGGMERVRIPFEFGPVRMPGFE